jgi:predicted nucleic acid-binding protein
MILDTTVVKHLNSTRLKTYMRDFLSKQKVEKFYITRISYFEILASTKYKKEAKEIPSNFNILEFDSKALKKAIELSNNYIVHSNNHKDMMIVSIGMANKMPIVTENVTDFKYSGVQIIGYNMAKLKAK